MKHVIIKQLRNIPLKRDFIPLLMLSLLSLGLWFGGPLIAIANTIPLEKASKRFYLILLVFSIWVFKKYYFVKQPSNNVAPFIPLSVEKDPRVTTLTAKFYGLLNFLNKTFISKDGLDISLNRLPWYLFIGAEGAGKTTLLANANVNYVLAKKFKPENIKTMPASLFCDWWVTRDMVLVDVPGSFSLSSATTTASLWHTLLNLMTQSRGKRPLQGVVLALSLPELLNLQKTSHTASASLKQQIHELRARFGTHLPFYFIITKCDTLPGFAEFFSDSGIDELSQAWGVTMPLLREDEILTNVFTQRFNALIKRLNKQLISRLHQERNSMMRSHIKDFPLHIERLKECIASVLTDITGTEKQFHLEGVYLTSAIQQHAEEHHPHLYNAAPLSKAMPAIQSLSMPSRPYFVRQLLMQGFANVLHTPSATLKKWQYRPVLYLLSLLMTIAVTIVIAADFRTNVQQTDAIRSALVLYQASVKQQDGDFASALPLLNALEARAQPSVHSWLFHSAKIRKHDAAAYQEALQNIILTEFKTHFETFLQTTDYKDPTLVYSVLKAYLALSDKKYFQADTVLDTLKTLTPEAFAKTQQTDLRHHLQAAFNGEFIPAAIDPQLVSSVRQHLATLPAVTLGFLILKNMPGNSAQDVLPLTDGIQKDNIHVSHLFTGTAFQATYDTQVENAALELVQGNWILGNNMVSPAQQNFAAIVDELRLAYVNSYASVWEKILTDSQLSPPHSLEETDAITVTLLGENSPLLQLIKVVKQNTAFKPITLASPKLAALEELQSNKLTAMTLTLRQLHNDLQKIITAHNPANVAYQAAAERFQDHRNQAADPITQLHVLAKTQPAPLRDWLNTLAQQSWHFTLQQAAVYADNHWQTDVMSVYHTAFENHYPLYAAATKETPIEQFAKFLSPNGTLTSYFNDMLQPFVEMKNTSWEWRKMDDEAIPFSDVALDQIAQVQSLQPIFFPDNNNQIYIKFTLQPMSITNELQSVTLDVNGQTLNYDRSQSRSPLSLAWPGNKLASITRVKVLSRDNHNGELVLPGTWGWFKLVNQSATRILNSHELMLTFNVDGHEAKYFLFTKGEVNPFLALQKVRLPETLLAKV